MEETFDLASVKGEAALVFQPMEADTHFGASVFWTRLCGAIGGEQALVEYWQISLDDFRLPKICTIVHFPFRNVRVQSE